MDEVIKQIIELHWKDLIKKKNVRYFSGTLKPKIRGDKEYPDIKCFRIYVTEKIDGDNIKFHMSSFDKLKYALRRVFRRGLPFVYSRDFVPTLIDNVPTDIIAIGEVKALRCGCPKRPITPGCSAMNYSGSACTLGSFGRNKKVGEEEFIGPLANNHCGARENKAAKGEAYLYPSPIDGGRSMSNKIGSLWRFVPLPFNNFTCSFRNFFHGIWRKLFSKDLIGKVDICLIKLEVPLSDITLEAKEIGAPKGKRRGVIGELAHKHGRTSCYTSGGPLKDNDWYGNVGYSRGTVMMGPCGLIIKEGFSTGGDSSSMIFWESDNYTPGFLFAGSTNSTIFCHWDLVEQELEVEILTEESD